MDTANLLFRRQFILGPEYISFLKNWNFYEINDKFRLSYHPDLEFTEVSNKSKSLILLGYILDPFKPNLSNKEIIKEILENLNNSNDIFSELKSKGGRYAIIYKTENSMIIFNDPAGYRQIFYYNDRNDSLWCCSQPSLLLEKIDLNVSQKIKRDLYSTPLFKNSYEYWFPEKVTLYENVFHLTANHYLDLQTFEIKRYWPKEKLARIDIDSAIRHCSKILEGIMTSAIHRFRKVAFGITSGLDTRILLSVSNSVAKQIHFFTHTHSSLDDSGSDVIIPKKILSDLNLDHNIFYHNHDINKSFESIFYKNVTAARMTKLVNAHTIYRYSKDCNDNLLVVNGVCSEITRNFYRLFQFFKLDAKTLCVLSSMSKSKIAYDEFSKWLSDAEYAADLGYNLLDLFYWENRNGIWSAMGYSEYDIAFESLSPFNCRSLLEIAIGVDKTLRFPPDYKFHKELIRYNWPELLNYPINPPENFYKKLVSKIRGKLPYEFFHFIKFLYKYYSS